MAEPSRRYNLIDRRKKPQGVVLKRWEVEYSKLINNENRRVPLETVKSAIRSAFEDDLFEQWRTTLKCQLSGQRIKVPARYADCTHIECFDLETFLRMKTQKNLLVCPICQKEIEKPLENLRIDEYIETVLSKLPDTMQVELLRDGSFTEVREEFVVPNVINDEEPFVQESNTPSSDIKQESRIKDRARDSLATEPNTDEEFNEHDAIEPAIQKRQPSSSNKSAANLIRRKRTLPMNDGHSRTKLASKRSNPKQTNDTKKLHKCDNCSYASAWKGDVVRHMRTHTGEKPFKCDHCSYACTQTSTLNAHVRTHSGKKPFKCDHCSYACSQKSNLIIHVRTHTKEKPYRCDVCPYASAKSGTLSDHMRTHTGEKPFKCSFCSFASPRSSYLNVHIRTHIDEKPYQCSECAFAGFSSSSLYQHIRRHHKKTEQK